jgi:hypothetical protein
MKSKIVFFNKEFSEKLLYKFGCNIIYIPKEIISIKDYLMTINPDTILYDKAQYIINNWDDNLIKKN